ncbi:MAG: DUF3396 domain-containing protein [Myxococcales bacterium]|nr:DUF3396 domain-containing protein [Myxococcales bacterium]
MSLNVGGIYVKAVADVSREAVLDAITRYWQARGATVSRASPLELSPLSLRKTGELGFAVAEAAEAEDDWGRWIAVYDSERYHGDHELARYLHDALDAPVMIFQMAGASDIATVALHGDGPPVPETVELAARDDDDDDDDDEHEHEPWEGQDWGEVEAYVSRFPDAFLYFNQLQRADPAQLSNLALLRFENIPHRPGSGYSGPDDEVLAQEQRKAAAGELAAALDGAALRELVEQHPDVVFAAMDGVAWLDPADASAREAILAMADVGIERGLKLDQLAHAAAIEGDDALLDRIFAAMSAGYWWGLCESRAHGLLVAANHSAAFRLLRRLVDRDGPSLTALNNFAHALAVVDEALLRGVDVDELLDAAEQAGPQNVAIYHNLACARVRLGQLERAIDAVEGAVRWGYHDIERMREDDDLAPLRESPRFAAAFEGGLAIALDDLVTRRSERGNLLVIARPVLELRLFLSPVARCAAPVAALLRELCAERKAELTVYRARGGLYKTLKKGKVARDLGVLSRLTAKDTGVAEVHYGQSLEGEPGPWDVRFKGYPEGMNLQSELSVCWPWTVAMEQPDELAARLLELVARLPFEAGGAGLSFGVRLTNGGSGADYANDKLRPRFVGFEHHPRREWNAHGRSPGSAWLTFLSAALVEQLGGAPALASAIAPAQLCELGKHGDAGVCARASRRPPIGLVTAANDVGALPAVARALAPLRVEDSRCAAHYARLDAIDAGEFENA